MSLPPISPSNKFMLPVYTRNNHFKFKTSSNIKILNPLVPMFFTEKVKNYVIPLTKASEVMSPIPPPSLYKSKKGISRLSPIVHQNKPCYLKKTSSKLKQKYFEFLETERHSDLSMDFNRPIRDYFEETLQSEVVLKNKQTQVIDLQSSKNIQTNGHEIEMTEKESKVGTSVKENLKPRYASFVMPPPLNIDKKNLRKEKSKSNVEAKDEKNVSNKFINQSLQTDVNSFEFDEWEFDYDA